MTDTRAPLRRYLEARIGLNEPPLILAGLSRREALSAVSGTGSAGGTPTQPSSPSRPTRRARSAADVGVPRDAGGATAAGRAPLDSEAPPTPELARLAREGTADRIRELDSEELRTVAVACTRCALHEGRRHVVFGEGTLEARMVCVGEAPGAVEDETGRPFVGRAGQLLDLMLTTVGLRRDEVYICNVLKCRPPQNRNPHPEEIAACAPFLLRQIDLINPAVIVAFGSFAAQTLLGTRESIGRLRGRTHLYGRYPLVVTYHPAASLRNPGWKRPTWEDLQIARRVLDGGATSGSVGSSELSLGLS